MHIPRRLPIILCLPALCFGFAALGYSTARAEQPQHPPTPIARAGSERAGNPVFPGWYADPEAIVYGDTYWIFPTYSDHDGPDAPAAIDPASLTDRQKKAINPRYLVQRFFDAFSSNDLCHWQKHEKVLKIEDIPWADYALWAPSVIHANDQYYLFFSANDIQNDDELGGIGVAVADRPEGPYRDALGKPLVSHFHHGAQPIDPFVFRDDDGRHYLYYGGWRHCNVARLSDDLLHVQAFDDGTRFKEITPAHYVEGPLVFKRHGRYYLMWSEGSWGGPNYSVAYAMADSPLGPFHRIGKILQQDPKVATGAGHHSVIPVPGSDIWYIVYHRRPPGHTNPNHRVVCIDSMHFNVDGKIRPVKLTREGVMAHPRFALRAERLRCEYLQNPIGLDEPKPQLSWIVTSARRDERQTAFQVQVASSAALLAQGKADLWDSGKVASDRTTNVTYDGKPMVSRERCHWRVRSWNRLERPGPWSQAATWEMGLLSPGDWSASWIEAGAIPENVSIQKAVYYAIDGSAERDVTEQVAARVREGEDVVASNDALGGDPAPNIRKRLRVDYKFGSTELTAEVAENATANLIRGRIPYLRTSFKAQDNIRRARLYVTALGLYEIRVNGQRVGDQRLAPGWTDYRRRVPYQVYDVTGMIEPGANALGAIVGPGWFSGRAGLFGIRQFYGQTPALLAQLEITYADGSQQRVVSDASWRRHAGPLLAADIMDGATFDAAARIPDWSSPAYDDSTWQPAGTREESRNLAPTADHPVRQLDTLLARAVSKIEDGKWVFDLGQNMVGVVRLQVNEPPGTVIRIRHGEILNPDGTLYTANLRGAAATDTYICGRDGVEVWQPRFTFHGFRYVEVSGLSKTPEKSAVTGIVLGSDLPAAGSFTCSDERLNQLQSNIVWGMRGNYVSIPTDCPQRDERMGWTGDAEVFAPTASYNADVITFLRKWIIDLEDAQRNDGAHSDVAPVTRGLSYGTPAWGDAGTIVPWTLYQFYGDKRILAEHVESMKRWVEYCRVNSTDLIRDKGRGNDYGDWLSIHADTPKELIGTAYFAHSADILARSMAALGRREEAKHYADLFHAIASAFTDKYVNRDGHILGDTQTGYLLALRFDLVPKDLRPKLVKRLLNDIKSRDWRLSTGFIGVSKLLPVLADAGNPAAAYRLLRQEEFPSWLFSVKHGATTIWERWNGWTPETGPHPQIQMNSFNHYALGSCGEWLFEGIGGIRIDPDHPGFSHFVIKPQVAGPLSSAETSYRSVHGLIRSAWQNRNGRVKIEVQIPTNTTATLFLPAQDERQITESGSPLGDVAGIRQIRASGKMLMLELGSGDYVFRSPM